MKTLSIILLSIFVFANCDAQVFRLLATVTKHSSVPANPANNYVDSSYYYYLGNKGLSTKNNNFISDSQYYFQNDTFQSKYIMTYDARDNLLSGRSSDIFGNESLEIYNYDAGSNVLKFTLSKLAPDAQPMGCFVYSYDTAGNLIKVVRKFWGGTFGLDSSWVVYTFAFDVNNNRTSELQQTWDSLANIYHNIKRIFFNNNAQNQLKEKFEQYWDSQNSSWVNYTKETYSYDAQNDLVQTEFYNWVNNWEPLGKTEYKYDTRHNNLERSSYNWQNNIYELSQQIKYTYTDFNKPKTELWAYYFPGLTRYDYKQYYYGVYWPSTILKSENKPALKLHPNPATNVLMLELDMNMPVGFSAAIYDVSGRLYRQWTEKGTSNYKRSIAVEDLPAGNYIIKLSGGIEDVQRFVITR